MIYRSKKILFFCNVDWFLLSHRHNLIMHAIKSGYEVHVACLVTRENSEFEALEVKVHPLRLSRKGTSIFNFILNFFNFLRLIIQIKPDILHCITSKPNLIGGVCARLVQIPRVVIAISGFGVITSQNTTSAKLRRWFVMLLYKLVINRPNVSVIVQNRVDFELSQRLTDYKNQVHLLLGSGVDLKKFKPPKSRKVDNDRLVVLFASRLLKSKGINVFFDIARRKSAIMEQLGTQRIEFWVAGKFDVTNPECITEVELMQNVRDGHITYKGDVEDMVSLLNKTSVLVLPTLYGEGLPKVICEAASCGVPVIASDVPGCRQGINDAETGYLINKIGAESFSKQLVSLLENKTDYRNMSKAARKHAESNFDVSVITEKHFNIYLSG